MMLNKHFLSIIIENFIEKLIIWWIGSSKDDIYLK